VVKQAARSATVDRPIASWPERRSGDVPADGRTANSEQGCRAISTSGCWKRHAGRWVHPEKAWMAFGSTIRRQRRELGRKAGEIQSCDHHSVGLCGPATDDEIAWADRPLERSCPRTGSSEDPSSSRRQRMERLHCHPDSHVWPGRKQRVERIRSGGLQHLSGQAEDGQTARCRYWRMVVLPMRTGGRSVGGTRVCLGFIITVEKPCVATNGGNQRYGT
jgi:hypothetical protein